MTDCSAVRRLIGPYLDGELVGHDRSAVEAHLAACEACRGVFSREASFAAAVSDAVPRPAAPAELKRRVGALLPGRARARAKGRRSILLSGLAASLVAAGVWLWRSGPGRGPGASEAVGSELVAVAVDSHLRYAAGRLPLEVRSDRPEEVSRWFSGRVPFHVTLPDYPVAPGERKFYALEGGRLVALAGDYAAYVAYRMEGKPISLVVAPADKVRPWGRETVVSGALSFQLDSLAGLKVITWSDNGLTYALVSDLSVSGARSCLVCHGSPAERRKIEGFSPRT